MPQPFRNAVMTNDGARLLTRAQAGEIKIEFTRIAIGNGEYSEDEKTLINLQKCTGMKALKNSYSLSSVEVFSDYSVKITALLTNQDPITMDTLIHEGYFINEMGLFAKPAGGEDSTEILYSIAVTAGDVGDFMPPYNGYHAAQIVQEYYATVNNSAEVTIKTSGAAFLASDALKLKNEVQLLSKELEKTNNIILMLTDAANYETAFFNVFTKILPDTTPEDPNAMTAEEVAEAMETPWNGETSGDPNAMTAEEVAEAMETSWNGETSDDPNALSSTEIKTVLN